MAEPEQQQPPQQPSQSTGQSISQLVNQQFSQQLSELGFSKNVSEKALLMTNNASIEAAVYWITDHQGDADFEDELLIVGEEQTGPKLSKEEAAQKARELQQRLREQRAIKEKQDEEDRERQRVISGKQLVSAKREMEEAEQRRQMELRRKQKLEDEIAKKKMLEQLERDKLERFGKKGYKPQQEPQKTPIDLAKLSILQIKTAYPKNLFLDKAKVCLSTLQLFIRNVLKSPQEEKFRKINLGNQNFQTKVGEVFGGVQVLKNVGFYEQEGFLLLQEPNLKLLQDMDAVLTSEINSL